MFRVPNWQSFQSYKDRSPPWIRLHKRLLDDMKFQRMSAEARALLPMIWLLAAEDEDPVSGALRFGYETVAFRLRMPEKVVRAAMREILNAGFIVLDSQADTDSYGTVTDSVRNCHPETETETETETDPPIAPPRGGRTKPLPCPDGVSPQVWGDFLALRRAKKAPVTAAALEGIAREAAKAGWPLEAALAECCARGWQGFKADWVADKPQKGNQGNDTQSRINAATQRNLARFGCIPSGANNPHSGAVLCDAGHLREDAGTTGNLAGGDGGGPARLSLVHDTGGVHRVAAVIAKNPDPA